MFFEKIKCGKFPNIVSLNISFTTPSVATISKFENKCGLGPKKK